MDFDTNIEHESCFDPAWREIENLEGIIEKKSAKIIMLEEENKMLLEIIKQMPKRVVYDAARNQYTCTGGTSDDPITLADIRAAAKRIESDIWNSNFLCIGCYFNGFIKTEEDKDEMMESIDKE